MSIRGFLFPGMRGRSGSLALLFSALLLLFACGGSPVATPEAAEAPNPEAEAEEDAIAVRALPIERGALSALYTTSSTLRADRVAVVTARTQGVVQRLEVEEGDRVVEGQALAVLENDEQQIEFERASTAKDTLWREFERAESLHSQGLLSEEEYGAARRSAHEARQTAALAELQLARTVVRAPFSGTVLERHLDSGAMVTDGTAVYDLADLDPLFADVNVPERQIARLAPGQAVRLIADASTEWATARIERIAPDVDPATGTVKVTLTVDGSGGMRPGSFTRVEIVTETHHDTLVVPRSALVAEGRRWHLFRVDPSGQQVERVEVLRGFEERDRVEIVASTDPQRPLRAGEQVVVVGASALSDGARIRLIEPEDSEETEQTEGPGVPA